MTELNAKVHICQFVSEASFNLLESERNGSDNILDIWKFKHMVDYVFKNTIHVKHE